MKENNNLLIQQTVNSPSQLFNAGGVPPAFTITAPHGGEIPAELKGHLHLAQLILADISPCSQLAVLYVAGGDRLFFPVCRRVMVRCLYLRPPTTTESFILSRTLHGNTPNSLFAVDVT